MATELKTLDAVTRQIEVLKQAANEIRGCRDVGRVKEVADRGEMVKLAARRFPTGARRRPIPPVQLLATLSLLAVTPFATGEAKAGSIIYTVVDHPAAQDGYAVSGTITTDGAIGTNLPRDHITDWDITITQGTTTIGELSPSNTANYSTSFDASPTAITVPSPAEGLSFYNFGRVGGIGWGHNPGPPPSIYYSAIWPSHFDTLWASNLTPADMPVAIPEPSTAVIATGGLMTGIVAGLVRRRRARRRPAASGRPGRPPGGSRKSGR
jgi:hypothetical protein